MQEIPQDLKAHHSPSRPSPHPKGAEVAGESRRSNDEQRRRRPYLFSDVPAERRSSQASTTRLLMPASASFPQPRGSYAFLLPTSPSTFSTPS